MEYQLVIPKRVRKQINKIPENYRSRIVVAIRVLAGDPFLGKKLNGKLKEQRSYEVRPYRIVYEIQKYELVVLIIRVGHRQGIYG